MPQKLTTTVNKITIVPNSVNAAIIGEFYQYTQISYQTLKKNCLVLLLLLLLSFG